MTPTLHQCLKAFLLESALPVEEREYENPTDQIRELLVHKNYFSTKDIESCLAFDIQILSSEPNFEILKELFEQFVKLYPAEMVDWAFGKLEYKQAGTKIGNTNATSSAPKKTLSNFAAEAAQLKGAVLVQIMRVFTGCGIKTATIVVKNMGYPFSSKAPRDS